MRHFLTCTLAWTLVTNSWAQQLYHHNFGTLSAGPTDTLWHTFTYLNNSSDTIRVRGHQSSCECILSKSVPAFVSPMEQFPVRMGFLSAYRWGSFEKKLDWLLLSGDTISFVLSGHLLPQKDNLRQYFRHATDSLLWPERGLRTLGYKPQNHLFYSTYADTLYLSLHLSDSLWEITPSVLLVPPKQLTRVTLQRLPLPQSMHLFRVDTLFLYRQDTVLLGELPVSWSLR